MHTVQTNKFIAKTSRQNVTRSTHSQFLRFFRFCGPANKALRLILKFPGSRRSSIGATVRNKMWRSFVKSYMKSSAKICKMFSFDNNIKPAVPGAPLTHFNDGGGGGGGGVRVIFLGLKFWPKVIFLGV